MQLILTVQSSTRSINNSSNVDSIFSPISPGSYGCLLKAQFSNASSDWYLEYFKWSCHHENATGPCWWWVRIASGNVECWLGYLVPPLGVIGSKWFNHCHINVLQIRRDLCSFSLYCGIPTRAKDQCMCCCWEIDSLTPSMIRLYILT